METEKQVLERAKRLLSEERKAIRLLDIGEVERLSLEKQEVFDQIGHFASPSQRTDILQLLEAARHNCLLLAHARDLTASALAALDPARAEVATLSGVKSGARRAVRLSITG